ncbi:MAG TPA: hypothetical protein VF588_19820 [Pyrinomonadaceae bacterium]|jgi:hypothetical protein
MKKRISILAVCLVALTWATSESRPVHATFWVDDLTACVDDYSTDWFDCWETGWDASAQCQSLPAGPERDSCESSAQSNKVSCLSSSNSMFDSCAGSVNINYAAMDFCTDARFVADSCNNQFQGFDNTEARMACVAASGIDRCQ